MLCCRMMSAKVSCAPIVLSIGQGGTLIEEHNHCYIQLHLKLLQK